MPQKFLRIKNFDKYQSSKNHSGTRPWIRLWKKILHDPEFMKLSTHHRFLYIALLLLADDTDNNVYNDRTYLGQRLYIKRTEIDLKPLYRAGFLLTSNLRRVLSEESRVEKRREEESKVCVDELIGFDHWYLEYPKKVGKHEARKAWDKLNGSRPPMKVLCEAVAKQKQSEQWRQGFIPNPATWLNQHRWEDELLEKPLPLPDEPNKHFDPIGWQAWYSAYGKRGDV